MIDNFYSALFTISRMVWYEEFAERQEAVSFYGHIQQMTAELSQSLALTFTKAYIIWCPLNTDVEVGDRLVSGDNEYNVKAIKDLLVGNNKHKQLFVEREENYG